MTYKQLKLKMQKYRCDYKYEWKTKYMIYTYTQKKIKIWKDINSSYLCALCTMYLCIYIYIICDHRLFIIMKLIHISIPISI